MRSTTWTFVAVALTALLVRPAMATNPATGTIPETGQDLNIEITSPLDGAEVDANEDLAVSGQVAVGTLAQAINVTYIVDVSCSTEFTSTLNQDCNGDGLFDANDDINGDGAIGNTLDCEIAGVVALNDSLAGLFDVDAALVPFGSAYNWYGIDVDGAFIADVDPAAGHQDFAATNADEDLDGTLDLAQVARSLDIRNINGRSYGSTDLFTSGVTDEAYRTYTGTDFNEALEWTNLAFATRPAGDTNVAFFLSDGVGNLDTYSTDLQDAVDAGTVVNTYSIGSGASGCGPDPNEISGITDLQRIADDTGGTCTVVSDPADLSGALIGTVPAGIASVEISLDGLTWYDVTASLDALGNFSGVIPGAEMTPGTHTLYARVTGDNGPPATVVTADIQITAVLPNQPPVAVCDDVTVAVDDLCEASIDVDDVDGGSYDLDPGDTITLALDDTGPFAPGVYTVELTVTDSWGAADTCEATVTVIDDTPPTVTVAAAYEIWPPNHKYVGFTLDDCVVAIDDNCDAGLTAVDDGYIVSIYSDEEEDAFGKGDGKTTDDIVIYDGYDFDVRAERAGGANGRVYGVTFAVEDLSGNVWEDALCTIGVPHSQNGIDAVDDGPYYVVYAP